MNCNYRFKSELDKTAQMCPYCGKKSVREEPSAEEILNEE